MARNAIAKPPRRTDSVVLIAYQPCQLSPYIAGQALNGVTTGPANTPQLWWPEDWAWFVSTEIDAPGESSNPPHDLRPPTRGA